MSARPHRSALVVACVLAFAAPAASARTLRDAVRLAVAKAYAGSDGRTSAYDFGVMRLMSLTSDDVCGSFKRPDGASVDFFYSEGGVFLDTVHHQRVEERCHKPSRTTLTVKGRQWILVCSDAAQQNGRRCLLAAPLPNDDALDVLVLKTEHAKLAFSLFLETDKPDGRSVTLTVAGGATKCALSPAVKPDLFWPCDDATGHRLFLAFLDAKSMRVEFGGAATDLTSDGYERLFNEAQRYLFTFAGSEAKIPERP